MITLTNFATLAALALTAEAASLSKCKTQSPVVFDPAELEITDNTEGASFTVRLATPPAENFTYSFNNAATNVLFDKCDVQFTPENWNIPQRIRVITPIFLSKDTTTSFRLDVIGKDNGKGRGQLKVTRNAVQGHTVCSSGDPHFTTFQGQVITQQARAINYLFKSPHFDVMALQERCVPNSRVFCNQGVAIRYGQSAFVYDARDFRNITVTRMGQDEPGFQYVPPTRDNVYKWKIPDGSYVIVTPSSFSAQYGVHNTIKITLSPDLARTGGGILNSPRATGDNLIAADGRVYNSKRANELKLFFDSWSVPDSENIFNRQLKGTTPPAMPLYNKCLGASPSPSLANPVLPNYRGSWSNAVSKRDEELAPAPVLSAGVVDEIKTTCAQSFDKLEACEALVPTAPFVQKCVADGMLLGNSDMAKKHLEDYLDECAAFTKGITRAGDGPESGLVAVVMEASGFGNFSCPASCSGHGSCTEIGCKCDGAWSGLDCAIQL